MTTEARFHSYDFHNGMQSMEAIRANAADRAARALEGWKGHILAPSTRKADRAVTYHCILESLVDAVLGDLAIDPQTCTRSELARKVLAPYREVLS